MPSINTLLATAVNGYGHPHAHRHPDYSGLLPRKNAALRAFVVGELLRQNAFGIDSIALAAEVADVSRPRMRAALALLRSQDAERIDRVLHGESLLRVAKELGQPNIRIVPTLFDTAI
jgi:hypothetical protein